MARICCPDCGERIPKKAKYCPRCAKKKDIQHELDQILKNPDINLKTLYRKPTPPKLEKAAPVMALVVCAVYAIAIIIAAVLLYSVELRPLPRQAEDTAAETFPEQEYTLAEYNALCDARVQLGYGVGRSRSGLIAWLEDRGYSEEAAVYAADHCGADWVKEAEKHLKRALDWGSHHTETEAADALRDFGFTEEEISLAIHEIYGAN